ncbi:hypothetical protein JW948_00370 [bacterium]|nr:hypothetical protein [bacterium]
MPRKILTISLALALIIWPLLIYSGAHISNFHARAENNTVVLEWNTESETGVARFEIERSMDKANWQTIDAVPSKAGTSDSRQYYQYTDNSVFKGNTSSLDYRLQIVDKNGQKTAFSVIASVSGSSGIRRTWGSLKASFR